MNEKHKIIAFFIMIDLALLGCSNVVEEASKDKTPPEILSVYATDQPAADPAVFPISSTFTIEFSEKINSDTLSTGDTSSTVRLSFAADETIVPGRVELMDETHAIYTPDAVPYMLTDYVLTIAGAEDSSGGIKDLAGNAMGQSLIFTFKTCGPLCSGTKQFGVSSEVTLGRSVATDPSGNVFVAGSTTGVLDAETLTGSGPWDSFVTKYAADGTIQWTKQLGGVVGTETLGRSVATDPSGNIFVAGYTSVGLDEIALAGVDDFFVTKYDTDGVKQ